MSPQQTQRGLIHTISLLQFPSLKGSFQTEESYEDPIEELLYAVFVVSSKNSTVAELATTLQADLSQLQAAASFVCRLGWAIKLIDPSSILRDSNVPGSPKSMLSDEEDGSNASLGSGNASTDGNAFQQGEIPWAENNILGSGYGRIAFLVDANITSYLMMGSVSPGLKSHAVTLYEAGKLGHASIGDLCNDLSKRGQNLKANCRNLPIMHLAFGMSRNA